MYVTAVRGCQERGDVELRSNTLISKHRTEIAGDRYTLRGMTLILDTDAGKHRVLKGGTKLGN